MWARALVLLLLVPACRVQYLGEEAEEYRNADFYDNYEETESTIPLHTTTTTATYTSVMKHGTSDKKRTVNQQDLRNVKDVLRDIFANRRIEAGMAAELTKSSPSSLFDAGQSDSTVDLSFKLSPPRDNFTHTDESQEPSTSEKPSTVNRSKDLLDDKDIVKLPTDGPLTSQFSNTPSEYDWMSTEEQDSSIDWKQNERGALKEAVRKLNRRAEVWEHQESKTILTTLMDYLNKSTERTLNPQEIEAVDDALRRFMFSRRRVTRSSFSPGNGTAKEHADVGRTNQGSKTSPNTETALYEMLDSDTTDPPDDDDDDDDDDYGFEEGNVLREKEKKKKKKKKVKIPKITPIPSGLVVHGQWHAFPIGWPYDTTRCPTLETTPYRMDMDGMLKLLANLTYEYDMNLVNRFSQKVVDYGIPTCPKDPWHAQSGRKTTPFNFDSSTVVAKCFVCGLSAGYIPQDAYCSDAFAGDFLPMVPQDPRARGAIAGYRKYCRFMDRMYPMENPRFPRSLYGRFSGGCSVRWTDITGVYTQRTCRSKRRAITGNHFGSKRMAKLEMALNSVDNGCIISPMASLLPLSRGVSLYARFHACVCTGAWCNSAIQNGPWMTNIIISFCLYNILIKGKN